MADILTQIYFFAFVLMELWFIKTRQKRRTHDK